MKYLSRLTALLLAFVLLFSSSVGAFAESSLSDFTRSSYDKMVSAAKEAAEAEAAAAAQEAASQPIINEGGVVYEQDIPEQTKRFDIYEVITDAQLSMGGETEITLPQSGKINLSAGTAAQWQIYIPGADMWVNIAGETGDTFALTYAVIGGMLSGGSAKVRALAGDSAAVANVSVAYGSALPPVEEEDTFVAEAAAASTFALRRSASTSDANAGIMLAAEGDEEVIPEYIVEVKYLSQSGKELASPYTAEIQKGSNLLATFACPTIQGYVATAGDKPVEGITFVDGDVKSININITNITDHIEYTVVYKPTVVKYTVEYYQQNLNDDKYTLADTDDMQGLTEDIVNIGDVSKKFGDGFTCLLYEKPEIAADGSTKVQIYYDRNYFLMLFELSGGYGVEPICARYGTPIAVDEPTRPGYSFGGWDPALPATMPAEDSTHTAIWKDAQTVDYTIVYWRENANDDGYSFWHQETKQAVAGSVVSGSDSLAASDTVVNIGGTNVTEKNYFTYNDELTQKNVVINGDGSSVINVYYTRNVYTLIFYYNGECQLDEHSHTENCYEFACDIEEHDHEEDGCVLTCGKTNHTHTIACTHTAHTYNCYPGASNTVRYPNNVPNAQKVEGRVYSYRGWSNSYTVIYINGQWYDYDGDTDVGGTATPNCGGIKTCTQEAHVHSDSCYDCGKTEHTHTQAACYKQTCGKTAHTHSDANCRYGGYENSSDYEIFRVITAKYDAYIGDEWPTAADISGFSYWTGGGVTNQSSKLLTMVANICISGGNKFLAHYNSTLYTLNYMFESFDQTSAANGTTRLYYNGKYYDKSEEYSQTAYYGSTSSWGYKDITGLTPAQSGSASISNRTAYLYYNRSRWTLSFQSRTDELFTTGKNVMFEQPLKDYIYNNTKISTFVPPEDYYPEGLPEDVYIFEGWYTTPECYEGTKVNFDTLEMPNGDLTLYANWAPIELKVNLYPSYEDYDADTNQIGETIKVPYNSKVEPAPADPTNSTSTDYKFVGWFYMENGEEKAFDFNNMPVTKNLDVYAKWSSNVLKNYFVYYKVKTTKEDGTVEEIEIAKPTTGSALAGTSKTFQAKAGVELYSGYQEGYFPETESHTITVSLEDPTANSYTFYYVPREYMPYTVKYVNAETGESMAADKYVEKNLKSVVTETFVPFSGFVPDEAQKRLVVTVGGENVITFYYTPSTTEAYYLITHYTQNLEGDGWSEYSNRSEKGIVGQTYSESELTIPGFKYDSTVEGTKTSGELTATDVLHLKLYYTREKYPYKVRYLEEGSNKQLRPEKTTIVNDDGVAVRLEGAYGEVVAENAITIPGYTLVSDPAQSLEIAVETGDEIVNNIITFYYRETPVVITYVIVGPEGCGTLTLGAETIMATTGEVDGSTATANENFKFVGWYLDEDCTQKAPEAQVDGNNKFTPVKNADGVYETATYYAKFEYNLTDLTIKKTGLTQNSDDDRESAIFVVTDKETGKEVATIVIPANDTDGVTIDNLTVGKTYVVTEVNAWTWRYDDQTAKEVTIVEPPTKNEVTFNNTNPNPYWLGGDNVKTNVFE